MECLNRVELKGTVGQTRNYDHLNTKTIRFTMVTDNVYKDASGKAVIDHVWHNCVAFEGKKVKDLEKIEKGAHLHVLGRIRNEKYTDEEGVMHFSTEILINELEILDKQ